MTSTSGLVVEAAAPISDLLVPRPYRVEEKISEAPDIFSLHVVPVDGELPHFRPAQVSMLGAFGVGEAAISISSPVTTLDHHAYTIRRAGPISGALVDTPIGGTITVRGPFGVPWPIESVETSGLVIIGGGLGIAPLRAAIHEALDQSDRFEQLAIVYGAKVPEALVYRSEFDAWQQRGAELALIVDEGDENWRGPVGVVPDLLGTDDGLRMDWADTTAFICGPDPMMNFTAEALIRVGVPAHQIWITLERNMQCGNALCGHCQLGPFIVCRDGPVANYSSLKSFLHVSEL